MSEDETPEQATARLVAQTAASTARLVMEAAQAAAKLVAQENSTTLTAVAVMQTELIALRNQQTNFEGECKCEKDAQKTTFDKLFLKLDEIIQGRPTWAVSLIITFLSCSVVGLLVNAIKIF